MPIVFRCRHCGQQLSISLRKAGQDVTCPQCVLRTRVPQPDAAKVTEGDETGRQLRMLEDALPLKSQTPGAHPVRESTQKSAQNAWNSGSAEDEDEEQIPIGKRGHGPETGLDMTPMVDVVMLLLIFFMITASFATQKSLETSPPVGESGTAGGGVTADDVAGESVVVAIDESDNLFVDDVPISSIGELAALLEEKIAVEKRNELLIEAHPHATHGMVVAVTDAGLTAQMQHIRRTTKGER